MSNNTTTPMKWCEKSSALAATLHTANMAEDHAKANSKEALAAIGKAVAEEMKHTGKVPTFHGVRAKLSSMDNVYTPLTTTAAPKGGTVIAKASIVNTLKEKLGIDLDIGTLANANRADLEVVSKHVGALGELLIHNASREALERQLELVIEAEIEALENGADVADIAEAEQLTSDLVQS